MSPGRHAPESSKSFLISLGVTVAGAAAALGIVVGIALVALNAGSEKPKPGPALGSFTPTASRTPTATTSGSARPSVSPSSAVLPIKDTTIAALNGTKTPGLARGFADRAKKAGYPVSRIEQGPATGKSIIYYRPGRKEEALRLQSEFPEFTLVAPAPAGFKTDVVLTVVVGEDYKPPPTSSPAASPT